jgi:peroxiredoxin
VELQDRLQDLANSGVGIAAISYDSQEVLVDFAERHDITFPMLSDADSSVITEFDILNTVVAEALGPNRDDPDVIADVHKYVAASVFDSIPLRQMIEGTPFPGTFMLDADGRVTSRFFEEFYRERNTTSNVMLKLGIGLSPIAAITGETSQLKFTAYASNSVVSPGTRFSIAVDVEPGENMHVYAPGAETMGYRVIDLRIAPSKFVRFEPIAYPDSEIYHFKPLDEYVPVYQEPFTLLQEGIVNASAEAEEAMAELDALTLIGSFDYQVCDDTFCFNPVSVPLSFTLELELLDYQRVNR